MATRTSGAHADRPPSRRSSAHTVLVTGWTLFASVLMVFGGLLAVATGVTAVRGDNVLISTRDYVFHYDLTGWGWIHIVLGIVIALAGFALLTRALWARLVGIVLAGLGLPANFLWLPHFPVWAVTLMAIDVFVIWALCADLRPRDRA